MQDFFTNWFLHLDTHLAALAANHGSLAYLVLFAVIFIETGVVIMPFLPGDSLLFVAGMLAGQEILQLPVLVPTLIIAAIAGDSLNYAVGAILRQRTVDIGRLRFLKPEYIARTHAFFEQYGGKTIVLARFVPIVRTLAPFVAAFGQMKLRTFLTYNIIGAVAWVALLVGAGYALGNVPVVRDNLNIALLAIVLLSIAPGIVHKITEKNRQKKS